MKNLSVECILGGDFLGNHSAVIDCRESTLTLGNGPRCQVPSYHMYNSNGIFRMHSNFLNSK